MSTVGQSRIPGGKTAAAIFLAFVALALFAMVNQPGGPVAETTGTVESIGFVPSDSGPPPQVASVRLADGAVVQAEVLPGVLVQRGQIANVRVYRRVITGAQTYALFGPKR